MIFALFSGRGKLNYHVSFLANFRKSVFKDVFDPLWFKSPGMELHQGNIDKTDTPPSTNTVLVQHLVVQYRDIENLLIANLVRIKICAPFF